VMLAAVDFMSFCSMSIMAPFYPQEAATKGMTESMAGFVFGFYALVVFLSSPVFGKILPKVGLKTMFTTGVLISGLCSLVFGTLHTIDDYSLFTTFSFLIRGLEALGASAYSTASYVIIVNIFPDNAGAVRVSFCIRKLRLIFI
jgi:MFS family permease